MENNRYCVIMCGGIGSRFWPYSRESYPKQFIDFLGIGRSLLQISYDRIKGIVPDKNIVIVTNAKYKDIIIEQLPFLDDAQILLEPARRNTAPCIAWAINHIRAINPNASIMVAPSDHLILKEGLFRDSIRKGFEFVENNDTLLTIGVKPSRPETNYKYIQLGKEKEPGLFKVKTFTEKPNLDLANIFLQSGEFFWNSGIYICSIHAMNNALQEYAPEIYSSLYTDDTVYGTDDETDFIAQNFPNCPNISIELAVMEKAKNVFVETVDIGWNDLGTWTSLYENMQKDNNSNVSTHCKTSFYHSSGNIVTAKGDGNKMVVAVGLKDYVVADTDDVLLICPKSEEQHIKHFINDLKIDYSKKYI